jgi:hypothetical protein
MESADRLVGEEWTHTVRNKRQPTTRPQHQVGHVTPEHPAVVLVSLEYGVPLIANSAPETAKLQVANAGCESLLRARR